MVSRAASRDGKTPAPVRYRALPRGNRLDKFAALEHVTLDGAGWVECSTEWRGPFQPAATGAWATYPPVEDFFIDDASGVMPGRTWIIAPDQESLLKRWDKLIKAPQEKKEALFHPHQAKGGLGDRHIGKVVPKGLGVFPARPKPIASEVGDCVPPTRYGFRTFDRQWIIPDNRLINRPNPDIWAAHSDSQVYLTVLARTSPTAGPGLTITALIPDLDHYNGRGGRAFSLWQDATPVDSNIPPGLLELMTSQLQREVTGDDVFAYIAAVAASPAYTERFQSDLVQQGLRIPLTANSTLFNNAVELGKQVVWLHTFGERFTDAKGGTRPAGPPRLSKDVAPKVPAGGSIPQDAERMPDELGYDATTQTLHVGEGQIEHVTPAMWEYEVSGKRVLNQWFSYRKRNRERPLIGDRRPPSKLGDIQPEGWLADYTTELLNVLNVLGRLIELEPAQKSLLERICAGELIDATVVRAAVGDKAKAMKKAIGPTLFGE